MGSNIRVGTSPLIDCLRQNNQSDEELEKSDLLTSGKPLSKNYEAELALMDHLQQMRILNDFKLLGSSENQSRRLDDSRNSTPAQTGAREGFNSQSLNKFAKNYGRSHYDQV